MTPDNIGAAVRTIIATLGGVAMGFGLITEDQNGAIVAAAGAVANAGVLVWSLIQKFKQRAAVTTALFTPVPKE